MCKIRISDLVASNRSQLCEETFYGYSTRWRADGDTQKCPFSGALPYSQGLAEADKLVEPLAGDGVGYLNFHRRSIWYVAAA